MTAHECVICGAVIRESESEPERCVDCGGSYLLATGNGRYTERRPPTYAPGDHAAFVYDSDERCMSVLLPFVRDGVAAGDRVVGVVDDHTSDLLRTHLTSAEARRVEMMRPIDQYGAVFTADRTYDAWEAMISSTDGILRGFGGLDEPTAQSLRPAEWGRYERIIGGLLTDDALGMCLYDARYCTAELLDAAVGHPLLGARDKIHVCS